MALTRREALIKGGVVLAGLAAVREGAFGADADAQKGTSPSWTLPPLPYDYTALSPTINEETMRLHHDKHHQAYLDKALSALSAYPDLLKKTPEELLRTLTTLPEELRSVVQNHGGGHANHTLFWTSMSPTQTAPSKETKELFTSTFGGVDEFKKLFEEKGAGHFGSGWVWLVKSKEGKFDIITTANQDSPLMEGHTPILGNDLWEHAYYLTYKNKRAEYLSAWWKVVNWNEVEKRIRSVR